MTPTPTPAPLAAERFAIRIATSADIPALHALIEASVRGLQANDYTPTQIEGALGHALGLDTQLVEDGTYFVASPVGDPARIVACGGWSDRQTLFGSNHGPHRAIGRLDPATDAARIRAIFVHPSWARRGLGGLILRHCEAVAARAGYRRVEMGSTLTGVPLYTRSGYETLERVDVPLPNGEVLPVIRMARTLERSGSDA